MLGEFGIFSVLSRCNKNLKRRTDQRYSPWMYNPTDQCSSPQMDQCSSPMLQLAFIQKVKENTSSRSEGMATQETQREAPDPILAPLFMFFLLPLGLLYVNWASQECCLFYLRSSVRSSLFYFCSSFVLFLQAFPFLVFQPPPFWIPFSYSNYLTETMLKINELNINLQSYKKKLKTNANKKDIVMQIKAEINVIEINARKFFFFKGLHGGYVVKNLPASAGIPSLVQEDPTYCGASKPACHNC